VRVLDLTRLLPGGFCTLLLADFGADVVKVEDTGMGDYVRWAPPHYEGADPSAGGALFLSLNRGKRSLRVDLRSEAGREVLLRLVRDADVLVESFRPGVMDRLGVGWERLREANPRLVYCAITGYGQDGPHRDRAGHDTNYLALAGLLGLTGAADGAPVQAAGQIADLGGGALMAAFGILAALRERDASGEGQLVDVSMTDGALSWLAMVAARWFADGVAPSRGGLELAGGLLCYRPYRCADGWVALGALEPKFFRAWCAGVGREALAERQFEPVGSPAHTEVEAIFASRTRAEWQAFNDEHDCCLEPVLGLGEALESELVRARGMVVALAQPGATEPVRLLGVPVKLSRTPGDPARAPGPALGEHTEAVLREAGLSAEEVERLLAEGAVAGPADAEPGAGDVSGMSAARPGLKMSELADASGVSSGTIKHYLREGLLGGEGDVVRTSRNMAWYPADFVERIRLIKRLQEERFMPLRLIREAIDEDPGRLRALIAVEDRVLEAATAAADRTRVGREEVRKRYELPANVLDRLAEIGVLTPTVDGYDTDDVKIVEAIVRLRAGGYDEAIGFTVYDTLRYRDALLPLVREEVGTLLGRLAGEVEPEQAVEILRSGAEPLRELIGAMHSKLLLAELERQRDRSR